MPVTNVERQLKDGESVVSKTNLKGIITYVNKTFVEISGFSEEELIGAPQNIVRHPDMPPAAFKDLWDTLKEGKSWKGLVKNRCKDGGYYWVEANANPIWENGRAVGYMSLRTRPTREQVEYAEDVYKRIREGRARGITVKEGRILRTGLTGLWNRLRKPGVRGRIVTMVGALVAFAMFATGITLKGMNDNNEALRTVYEDRTVPLEQLTTIGRMILRNRIAIENAVLDPSPEVIREATAEVEDNIARISATWDAYMSTYLTPEEQQLASRFADQRKTFVADGLVAAVAMLRAGRVEQTHAHIRQVINPLYQPVREGLDALVELQVGVAKQAYGEAVVDSAFHRNLAVGMIAGALGLGLFLAWALLRAIERPLREVDAIALAVSSGDLTHQIQVNGDDEINRVLQSVKNILGNLRGIVSDVRAGSGNISTASEEIAAGNNDLSQRTQEQASALEETASSMEEMTSTVKQNADNARQANQLTASARDQAEKGGEVVSRAVQAMSEINTASKKIADIIGVIDEIAFQTNLLALNAAVEAARAGEQGRGFAVVAAEVRNLAQRSAGAAKEIKDLINDSVEKVNIGSGLVDESGKTLLEIVESVKKASGIVAEIAAASQEQSAGIEQVNKAVMQMDEVTQQNAALVEEASAASKSMEEQALKLVELMRFFRMGNDESAAPAAKVATARRRAGAGGQAAPRHAAAAQASAAEQSDDWNEF
jgi:PAS domain S-box-containing protein